MIKRGILALCLILVGSIGTTLTLQATPVSAACGGKILTFKPWFDGLTEGSGSSCKLKTPGSNADEQAKFIWRIALNIVDDMFQIVGYISAGYIIYGGFLMMISSGAPEKAARARKTIISAVAGLVISLSAVAIINLLARGLGL